MQKQTTLLPWEKEGWLEKATEWIHDQLLANRRESTGPIEIVHQRPWSAFLRMATNKGTVHFKAPAPAFHFEAALTQALARWQPECTVPLLAVDLERGWMLSADAGETLRSAYQSVEQIKHWEKILPLYVELQLQMVDRVPKLMALGTIDRRLDILPNLYDQLLDDRHNLRIGLKPGMSPEEYQKLCDLRPQVAVMCKELGTFGLPETLTHEEVHDANVLVEDDRYYFIDWSDSSVSFPLFSVLINLRSAAYRLDMDEGSREIQRLRDAYMEPWTAFETRERLSSAFDLAYKLAMIIRALSWQNGVGNLSESYKEPYLDYVPGWLQDFLKAEIDDPKI